ncbi:MAG TPA: ethylbenzene dehydrogenase-related protein [Dehalococcoidia bacterium]|nr:ethylbenzene dehydrogenase-related protein [Dehalococcoidia bacterium]
MKATKLQLASTTLLNPRAAQWKKVPVEDVQLAGTPLHLQPSRYVRTVWAGKQVGAVRMVKVQAAHNGKDIFFRLSWRDDTKNDSYGDGSVFPDAAAVIFPMNGKAPLENDGSSDAPVNLWFWRANKEDAGENLIARGLATEEPTKSNGIATKSRWEDGSWELVVSRPIKASSRETAPLSTAKPNSVGFAVWEGGSQERGSLHAHSRQWQELVIE